MCLHQNSSAHMRVFFSVREHTRTHLDVSLLEILELNFTFPFEIFPIVASLQRASQIIASFCKSAAIILLKILALVDGRESEE